MKPFILAFILVNLTWFFIPSFGTDRTHCPDGYAYRVTEHPQFEGSYVKCEDFDEFFQLLSKRKIKEAKRLVLL